MRRRRADNAAPEAQRLTEDHDTIAAQEVDHGKRIQDESGASQIGT